jgi:hypothetical protein
VYPVRESGCLDPPETAGGALLVSQSLGLARDAGEAGGHALEDGPLAGGAALELGAAHAVPLALGGAGSAGSEAALATSGRSVGGGDGGDRSDGSGGGRGHGLGDGHHGGGSGHGHGHGNHVALVTLLGVLSLGGRSSRLDRRLDGRDGKAGLGSGGHGSLDNGRDNLGASSGRDNLGAGSGRDNLGAGSGRDNLGAGSGRSGRHLGGGGRRSGDEGRVGRVDGVGDDGRSLDDRGLGRGSLDDGGLGRRSLNGRGLGRRGGRGLSSAAVADRGAGGGSRVDGHIGTRGRELDVGGLGRLAGAANVGSEHGRAAREGDRSLALGGATGNVDGGTVHVHLAVANLVEPGPGEDGLAGGGVGGDGEVEAALALDGAVANVGVDGSEGGALVVGEGDLAAAALVGRAADDGHVVGLAGSKVGGGGTGRGAEEAVVTLAGEVTAADGGGHVAVDVAGGVGVELGLEGSGEAHLHVGGGNGGQAGGGEGDGLDGGLHGFGVLLMVVVVVVV